jgi:hypothetical protein
MLGGGEAGPLVERGWHRMRITIEIVGWYFVALLIAMSLTVIAISAMN